jgi:hypothetical protein
MVSMAGILPHAGFKDTLGHRLRDSKFRVLPLSVASVFLTENHDARLIHEPSPDGALIKLPEPRQFLRRKQLLFRLPDRLHISHWPSPSLPLLGWSSALLDYFGTDNGACCELAWIATQNSF